MKRTRCGPVFLVALGCALAVGGAATVLDALAQSYPSRPVRIVVPTSPGGGNDFIARTMGQKLGERLGQQFIVDNRPGGGGSIGTGQAASATPDGHTLLLGFVGQLAMYPHVEKVTYDPLRDFTGASLLASSYHLLAVHPSLPARSVKQLIALARARPGELNYASGNPWTPTHLVPELFKSATGTNITAIQYKGSGPAAIGVLSGEAQVIFGGVTSIMPHAGARRLVVLAVTSPARSPIAPEVPTLLEVGVRGVEAPSWYAIAAPAATPRDVIDRLHGEIVKVTALPDYRAALERQAMEPQTATPAEFATFLKAEHDRWGRMIGILKAKDTFSR